MAQYVYTMRRVQKIVPPKREILKNISLNFFPGAKIGVLGLNGSGKSSLLKIMAGEDQNYEGEVVRMPNLKVGFLPQEPALDPKKTVRETVEESQGELAAAKKRLDEVYAAYAEPDADFDKLAAEQAKLEAIVNAGGGGQELEIAADALRLPPWEQKVEVRLLRQVTGPHAVGGLGLAQEILVHARHDLEQGALARAVGAEHSDLGPRVERQPDPFEDLSLGRDDLAQVLHREDELVGHRVWIIPGARWFSLTNRPGPSINRPQPMHPLGQ